MPIGDRNVARDYDLTVYATGKDGKGFYANAGACQLRWSTPKRPTVGRISYNTNKVESDITAPAGFQTFSRVAFHEVVHILGFSGWLYEYWDQTNPIATVNGRDIMQTP